MTTNLELDNESSRLMHHVGTAFLHNDERCIRQHMPGPDPLVEKAFNQTLRLLLELLYGQQVDGFFSFRVQDLGSGRRAKNFWLTLFGNAGDALKLHAEKQEDGPWRVTRIELKRSDLGQPDIVLESVIAT